MFLCKNWPLNCKNTMTLYRFPKSFFLKINFSPICYDILNEIAISQERNVCFQNFLYQNWAERTAITGNNKKSDLTFWDNWSILMCWVTYSIELILCIILVQFDRLDFMILLIIYKFLFFSSLHFQMQNEQFCDWQSYSQYK